MQNKKTKLSPKYKIERSNSLNTFKPTGMILTEVRFLAIYQSKINARDPSTRKVTFTLNEFCRIMEIQQVNVTNMKNILKGLLSKPIFIPNEDGSEGFTGVHLFEECRLYNYQGRWLVDIECTKKVLPYMFEMKRDYFTYELWNALKLKSVKQLRMYEILKQYEKIGTRIISLEELKGLLGMDTTQYPEFKFFKRDVLLVCQKALEEYTDIKYTFEPIKHDRITYALEFTITKNENFKDELRLNEFIKPKDLDDIKDIPLGEASVIKETLLSKEHKEQPQIIEVQSVKSKRVPKKPKLVSQSEISKMPFRSETIDLYYDLEGVYTPDELFELIKVAEGVTTKPEAYLRGIYYQIKTNNKTIKNLYKYTLSIILKDLKEGKSYTEETQDSGFSQAELERYERGLIENKLDLT